MANPTVTAIISATDRASPVIQQLGANSRAIAGMVERSFSALGKSGGAFKTLEQSAASLEAKLTRHFGNIAAGITGMATAATVATRKILDISKPLSEIESRIVAFGGASPEQAAAIREAATRIGTKLPGGPTAFMQAGESSVRANIPAGAVNDVAPLAMLYANMTRQDAGAALDALVQLTNMQKNFRDANGKPASAAELPPDVVTAAMKKTLGEYMSLSQKLPGKESDFQELMKMAGPAFEAAKLSRAERDAAILTLAEAGITGSNAGTYMRSVVSRDALTKKSYAAIQQVGLNYMDYAAIDPAKMNLTNYKKSLETTVGTLRPATAKAIDAAFADLQKSRNVDQFVARVGEGLKNQGRKSLMDDAFARRAAQDSLRPQVSRMDNMRLIADLAKSEAGMGVIKLVYGLEAGTAVQEIVNSIDKYTAWRNRLDQEYATTKPEATVDRAQEAYQNSFAAQWDRLKANLDALVEKVWRPWEAAATGAVAKINAMIEGLDGVISSAGRFAGALAAAAVAVTGVAGGILAGKLLKMVAETLAKSIAPALVAAPLNAAAPAAAAAGGAAAGLGGAAVAGGAAGAAARAGVAGGLRAWLWPAAVGLGIGELLGATDSKGTLWGLFDKPTDWIKHATGINFAKPFSEAFEGAGWQSLFAALDTKSTRLGGNRRPADELPPSWLNAETITYGYTNRTAPQPQAAPAFGPVTPAAPAAAPQAPVVVEGEGRLDAEVQVKVDPSPYFMSTIDRKIQQSTMFLRDKLGTSMSGTSGVNPAPAAAVGK